MNFILGNTKSGKTTFCHFLNKSQLTMKKSCKRFIIETDNSVPIKRRIGNGDQPKTNTAQYYGEFCDFPGFGDTRGKSYNLKTLI